MTQKRSTHTRMGYMGLIALLASLLTGCIFYEDREDFKIMGAHVAEIPNVWSLGTWKGRLLIKAQYDGGEVLATVDTATDKVIAYRGLSGQAIEPGFVISQENLLSYTVSGGNSLSEGGVWVYNLVTGGGIGINQPRARLVGSNDRLFMSYPSDLTNPQHDRLVEILDGYQRVELSGAPRNVYYVAAHGDDLYFRGSSRFLYHSHAGAVDSVNLGSILQDSASYIGQIVAHAGYLFVQMYRSNTPGLRDTSYVAVLSIPSLTLDKTIGLKFNAYNVVPPAPRIVNDKWYLCGSADYQNWRFDGVEVIDLNLRQFGGQLAFNEQELQYGMRDFVATGLHKGYVIDIRDHRVKKVTF